MLWLPSYPVDHSKVACLYWKEPVSTKGIPKSTAKVAFESALDGIKMGLKKRKSKVTLVGFGIFRNVYRKTRMGRNPRTGEKMKFKGRMLAFAFYIRLWDD
jgi:nucleoid DNA-binding protein